MLTELTEDDVHVFSAPAYRADAAAVTAGHGPGVSSPAFVHAAGSATAAAEPRWAATTAKHRCRAHRAHSSSAACSQSHQQPEYIINGGCYQQQAANRCHVTARATDCVGARGAAKPCSSGGVAWSRAASNAAGARLVSTFRAKFGQCLVPNRVSPNPAASSAEVANQAKGQRSEGRGQEGQEVTKQTWCQQHHR